MAKTKNSKRRRNIKTRRLLRGGKPDFIKIVAYNNDGFFVDYKIMYDSLNKEDQKKYSDLHRVYYSIGSKSLFNDVMDLFKIEPKIIKNKTKSFFSLPGKNPNYKSSDKPSDYQTIAIHHPDDIKKIQIANQIIKNINKNTIINDNTTNENIKKTLQKTNEILYSPLNSIEKIKEFIKAYRKFIMNTNNSNIFLGEIKEEDKKKAIEMLNTPVFLEIIGKRYGFINQNASLIQELIDEKEPPIDLDKIKELMDAESSP